MSYESFVKFLKEHIVILAVSFAAFSSQPAIVHAQSGTYNPILFTEPLNLSRGKLSPGFSGSSTLPKQEYCQLMLEDWGWASCDGVDALVIQHVELADNTLVFSPVSEGHVKLDDWWSGDRDNEISIIEDSLKENLRKQSEKTGEQIEFVGWRAYPALNDQKKYMYYATDIMWSGELLTNIKATVFDRRGYVVFEIVPLSNSLSSTEIETLINATLDHYTPIQEESYAAFQNGDKVAAVGAVGVLAGLVGVKYGKTAVAGLTALGILLLKKAWFVLFLPIMWLGRIFRRKAHGQSDARTRAVID